MTDIDRRVRILVDILIERGFGWLAVEIIEAIEHGRENTEDHDPHVSVQRMALNGRLLNGEANAVSTPEGLKSSATRPEIVKERLSPREQILFAVDLFVGRLSEVAEMTSKSADELNILMGASVSLSVEIGEEARAMSPSKARDVATGLREIREKLIQWLSSAAPSEEG